MVVVVVVASFVVALVVVFLCVLVVVFVSAFVLVFLGNFIVLAARNSSKAGPAPLLVGASSSPDGWWSLPRKRVKVRAAICSEVSLEVLGFKVNECAVR